MSVKKLEEIIARFSESLPDSLQALPEATRRKIKEHLTEVIAGMDLVTREEFEVQKKLLVTSRIKIEELEKKLAEAKG